MTFQKLSKQEVDNLLEAGGIGYYSNDYGACIGDAEQVIVEGRLGYFLIPASEFKTKDSFLIRLNDEATLAIGGFPKTEDELLAEEMNISVACARDVLYLRTRSRWSKELEQKLIQAHSNGEQININDFGVTKETQAQLWWNANKK